MDILEELEWRGMLHSMTAGAREELNKGIGVGYIGFDPTAPSLTIGNYVQLMILQLWQKAGHQPIFLVGGATGRIGDPSGKSKERVLMTLDKLEENLQHQVSQAKRLLNFDEGPNKAIMVNNYDFYKKMDVLTFLRDVGKNTTINYMLAKDSVKNRLESGLSFTEFSYQLLQAYDFLCLYNQYNCKFQMGGSDQWGNITAGTEFIKKSGDSRKAYGITTPLLTKSDGKKFGKSEEGNIWLDASMTSPYKFYQFWIRTTDDDVIKFYKYFSLDSREVMIEKMLDFDANPNMLKKSLAEEMTKRIHTEEAFRSVELVSDMLFNNKARKESLLALSSQDFKTISNELPTYRISKEELNQRANSISELLTSSQVPIFSSKGELRRAVKNNAVSINKDKVSDAEMSINFDMLLHDSFIMIENGKKNKFLIEVSQS